jgi:hypothetical protein
LLWSIVWTLSLLHFSFIASKVTPCVRIYISHYLESRSVFLYENHDLIKAWDQFTVSKLKCKLKYVGCKYNSF